MKNFNKLALIMMPIGAAINMIGGSVLGGLTMSLVLGDSIGTILVAATCGPVAGIITGLLGNVARVATAPIMIFYAPISAVYGLIAGLLAKKMVFKSMKKMLLSVPLYAIIGSVIGTSITYTLMSGEFTSSMGNMVIAMPLDAVGVPRLLAMIIGATVFDLIDKIFVIIVVALLLKAIPERFLMKLPGAAYVIKRELKTELDVDD